MIADKDRDHSGRGDERSTKKREHRGEMREKRGGQGRAEQRLENDVACSMNHACMCICITQLKKRNRAMSSVFLPRVTHIYVSLEVS